MAHWPLHHTRTAMGKKFYAVRRGHRQGIFESWAECQNATAGFSGALFKSFGTRAEAEAFLRADGSSAKSGGSGGAATAGGGAGAGAAGSSSSKYYAVRRGRQPGVYESWSQVQGLVSGFANADYRSFPTREEAQAYVGSSGSSGSSSRVGDRGDAGSAAKRQRSSTYEPPPPPAFSASDGAVAPPPAAAAAAAAATIVPVGGLPAAPAARELMVTIYFDGGSRGNPGRAGYGYAVFDRETNERLYMGCRPLPFGSTNNEAEYSGMIAGMRHALDVLGARHAVLRGDSELVVRQMSGQYGVKGERLLPLFREAKQLAGRFVSCEVQHVYREENTLADRLSNLAMDMAQAVAQIPARAAAGASRQQLVALLTEAAAVNADAEIVQKLCVAPSFLQEAAELLAKLWEQPAEEVLAQLQQQGWSEATGGPAAPVSSGTGGGAGVVAAAAAAAGGGGGAGLAGMGSRALPAVAVAAVSLGADWAAEVRRQEQLMQQHEQQQRQLVPAQQQRQRQLQLQQVPPQQLGRLVGSMGGGGAGGRNGGQLQQGARQPHPQQQQQRGWPAKAVARARRGDGSGRCSSCGGAGCPSCCGGERMLQAGGLLGSIGIAWRMRCQQQRRPPQLPAPPLLRHGGRAAVRPSQPLACVLRHGSGPPLMRGVAVAAATAAMAAARRATGCGGSDGSRRRRHHTASPRAGGGAGAGGGTAATMGGSRLLLFV